MSPLAENLLFPLQIHHPAFFTLITAQEASPRVQNQWSSRSLLLLATGQTGRSRRGKRERRVDGVIHPRPNASLWVSLWPSSKGHSLWVLGTALSFHPFTFRSTNNPSLYLSSVQFSRSVISDSLQPHESQHARPPWPSPTPGVYSNSCPSSRWCHRAISSPVVPFSSCPQSLPASGSFPTSQLFAWGGQSIGVSASASVLPMSTQDWSALVTLPSPIFHHPCSFFPMPYLHLWKQFL